MNKRNALLLTLLLAVSVPAYPEWPGFTADQLILRNYRNAGDWAGLLPGVWLRDPGAVGYWTTTRIRGSEDNIQAYWDDVPLVEPWMRRLDMNLIPAENVGGIGLQGSPVSAELRGLNNGIYLTSKSLESKRPYTRVVYRNRIFNEDTEPGFNITDITYSQFLTEKISVLSALGMEKFGEDITGLKFEMKQLRAKIGVQLLPSLKVGYAVLNAATGGEYTSDESIPVFGDTLWITEPKLKQKRTDHIFTAVSKINRWEHRLTFSLSSHDFEIRDRAAANRFKVPVSSRSVQVTQSVLMDSWRAAWGGWGRQEWMDPVSGSSVSQAIGHGFGRLVFYGDSTWVFTAQMDGHIFDGQSPLGATGIHFAWTVFPWLETNGNMGQTFRDPSLGERFGKPFYPMPPDRTDYTVLYSSSTGIDQRISLSPERLTAWQAGIRFKIFSGFDVQTAVYHKTVDDAIRLHLSEDGDVRYTNRGTQKLRGFEGIANLALPGFLRVESVFNLIQAEDDQSETLVERPGFWGNTAFGWGRDLFDNDLRLDFLFSLRYATEFWRYFPVSGPEGGLYLQAVPATVFLDAKVSLLFLNQARITFSADNVLDVQAAIIPGMWLPARTLRLGVYWDLQD